MRKSTQAKTFEILKKKESYSLAKNANKTNRVIKSEKGSITVYVLASMLFMLIMTSTIYMNVSNKTNEQEKQLDKIVEEYQSDQPGQPDYKKLEEAYE